MNKQQALVAIWNKLEPLTDAQLTELLVMARTDPRPEARDIIPHIEAEQEWRAYEKTLTDSEKKAYGC